MGLVFNATLIQMKTIIVLTDFSKAAEHAAKYALYLAAETNSDVLLYHVFFSPELITLHGGLPYYGDYPSLQESSLRNLNEFKRRYIREREKEEPDAFIPTINCRNGAGPLGEDVETLVKNYSPWMIVMGDKSTAKDSISQLVFGSSVYDVLSHLQCPVLVVPQQVQVGPLRKIAYATALEEGDRAALHFLVKLAAIFRADICITHVCNQEVAAGEKAEHALYFKNIKEKLNYPGLSYHDIRGNNIPDAIERFSNDNQVDLVTVIHKNRSFFERIFHTSITKGMTAFHKHLLLILPD